MQHIDQAELFQLFFDNVADYAFFLLDPEGRIITWNSRAERILGYKSEEVIGQHVKMFRTAADHAAGKSEDALRLAVEAGSYEEIKPRARKDGTEFDAQVVVTPLRDEKSQLKGYGMIVRDITQHSVANMHIQASEQKLRSLVDTVLDTIVDGVITIDERGRIQSYNKACVRLFGYSAEEVHGQNVRMLMPEPYRAEHDGYLKNYQSSKVAKIIGIGREVSGQHKDGSVFPMELAVGATNQGGNHAFVGIIRDITERVDAEKQREQLRQAQKMEAIGQLTGGVAHDFNNLLAIITGNLDFMAEQLAASDPLHGYIKPAIDAAMHGSELTKQLLAFSRRQALQPRVMSANALVESFSNLVKRTLGERIELVISLAPNAGNIFADQTQLETALLNLSVNARHAMPNGGKLIYETRNTYLDQSYADMNEDVEPGEYVLIAISDTGTGMTPEVIAKAFDPFFTTKELGKGSGLGLSMVYGFVKQSAGHIKLYSEVGHGTSVRIYLPRVEKSAYERKLTVETEEEPQKKSKLILIVEDNPDVLALTSAMTESLGYDIITAENGDDALRQLEQNTDIDLLLTDVMLPGSLNGPVLAKRALAMYPNIKVLFNSGYAEQAIIESGLLDKHMHMLSKPFRKPQLAHKLNELLGDTKPA